jgi:hypothetical protein
MCRSSSCWQRRATVSCGRVAVDVRRLQPRRRICGLVRCLVAGGFPCGSAGSQSYVVWVCVAVHRSLSTGCAGNSIGRHGAAAIAQGLQINKRLKRLNISRACMCRYPLHHVEEWAGVAGNRIGSEGMSSIASAIRLSRDLVELNVNCTMRASAFVWGKATHVASGVGRQRHWE